MEGEQNYNRKYFIYQNQACLQMLANKNTSAEQLKERSDQETAEGEKATGRIYNVNSAVIRNTGAS